MELENDEKMLGKWTLNYIPPQGGRYTGSLIVTDKRLLFDAKFDTSFTGALSEAMFYKSGSEFYLQILKSKIKLVEEDSSFFSKKIVLTLDDGSKHVFNYGMLSVKKVLEAVKA